MHKNTSGLKEAIEQCGATRGVLTKDDFAASSARNDLLHNAYAGETAYILTCGPSLKLVWNDALEKFLADKLVIAVKQAHHLCADICDFHLYNEVRMEHYDYPADTIRLGVSEFMEAHPPHIHYPIHAYTYEEALFCTNDYERWRLDKSAVRPWGVGIMFELGLHLPIHLGCKKVVIVGFDMNPKGSYHFYDDNQTQDSKHYNVDDDEFVYAAKSTGVYHAWCQAQGVETYLYSPLSQLQIPQTTIVTD